MMLNILKIGRIREREIESRIEHKNGYLLFINCL